MNLNRRVGDVLNKIKSWLVSAFATPQEHIIQPPSTPEANPDEPSGSTTTFMHGPWSIYDGVNYNPPLTIPSYLAGNKKAVATLTEAYERYHSQFSDPYLTGEPVQMLTINNPLKEWDFQQRKMVLEQCHLAWERNPLANAAVTYNRLFAVQNGARITYRNEKVKEAIEAFINNPENDFRNLEKSMLDTLQVEGELFIRFHRGGGEVIWTCIPAWGVEGIEHQPGFIRRVLNYHINLNEDNGIGTQSQNVREAVPARDVHHVKINAKSYEQRGRPEIFKILPYAKAYKDWLEQRARQNHFKGSFVLDIKLIGATGAQVGAKQAQYKQPPSGASVYVHNDKEEAQIIDPRIGAQDAAEDGRQIRLMLAAGVRIPEYMLADGSNANLASATAQSLPALRSFGEWQDVMKDQVITPALQRVLEAAGFDLDEEVDEQSDGENTGEKIKVREAFEVKYPDLESDDPKNLAEALSIATDKEWMSDETAAGLLPFDINPQDERRKIEAEMEREQDYVTQGLKPDMTAMFGQPNNQNGDQPGNEGKNGNNQDGREDEREPATASAA
jgi:hypothetical protein